MDQARIDEAIKHADQELRPLPDDWTADQWVLALALSLGRVAENAGRTDAGMPEVRAGLAVDLAMLTVVARHAMEAI